MYERRAAQVPQDAQEPRSAVKAGVGPTKLDLALAPQVPPGHWEQRAQPESRAPQAKPQPSGQAPEEPQPAAESPAEEWSV